MEGFRKQREISESSKMLLIGSSTGFCIFLTKAILLPHLLIEGGGENYAPYTEGVIHLLLKEDGNDASKFTHRTVGVQLR